MIASAFVDIAAGDDGDEIEAAHALTRWSMRLLDISGAGVMMADDRGVLRCVMVSSDAVRTLEAAELDHGKGPCVESHRIAGAVIHADVDVADARWPDFGPLARAGGVRSAHAIPVLGGGDAIGVLNLFRTLPGGLDDADAALARALADAAGATAYHHPSTAPTRLDAEQLAEAFADAAVVEQAKGMLAVRLRVGFDTAFALVRRVARDRDVNVEALAAAVVDGTTTITLPLSFSPPSSDAAGTE